LKYIKVFESLVDDKIQLIKDLSLDMSDDGYHIYVVNCGPSHHRNDIPNIYYQLGLLPTLSDSRKIMVFITYKNYAIYLACKNNSITYSNPPNMTLCNNGQDLSKNDFKKRIDSFTEDCESYGLKLGSNGGGDYFRILFFDKWGKRIKYFTE
jgi:hypothetical protein